MSIAKDLKDKAGNRVYPVTKTKYIYMPNNRSTLQQELESMRNENGSVVFKSDGSITKTSSNGNVTNIVFNGNVITETTADSSGNAVSTKTTTFSSGRIDIVATYSEE